MGDLQPYEESVADDSPGDTIMWFGKYEGRNWSISEIEEHDGRYSRWLIEQPWPNCVEYKGLREGYLAWLDERDCPLLTTKVWFGDVITYKGKNFLSTYFDRRRWQWLLDTQDHLRPGLEELEQRYLNWQARNPEEDRDLQQAYSLSLEYRDHERLDEFNPMLDGFGVKQEAYAEDDPFDVYKREYSQQPLAEHPNRVIIDLPSRGPPGRRIAGTPPAHVADFSQDESKFTPPRHERDEDTDTPPSTPPRKRSRISPSTPADEGDTGNDRPATPIKVEASQSDGLQTPPQTVQRDYIIPAPKSEEPTTPSGASIKSEEPTTPSRASIKSEEIAAQTTQASSSNSCAYQ